MASSYPYYRSSSRPSSRFPDSHLADATVEEEIHREFPPGSQYQQWMPAGEERIYERRRIVERHPPVGYHPSMYREHRPWDDPEPEAYRRHRSRSRPASDRRRSPTPRRRYKDDYTHSSDRGYDDHHDKGSESRSHRKKSSSSDGKDNFRNLALAGVLAASGKTAYDYYRSRSRGRSADASDERSRPRSRSRTDRSRADDTSDYYGRELYYPEDEAYYSEAPEHFRPQPERRRTRSLPGSVYYDDSDRYSTSSSDSSCSSVSSSDEERTRRKLLRKELLTTGFATIATIHAGHGLYESQKKRKERMKQLKNGSISPEEARKQRLMGNLKDAAGLSLAALGIKKTIDEWKEAAKTHSEYMTHHVKCKERASKRERRRASVANVDY